MKIGLLTCDAVNESYRQAHGDYPDMFRALLPELEIEVFNVFKGEFPESPDVCDGYLTTGSRFSVYDDVAWIHQLKIFVKEIHDSGQKYIGVCFGHQLLGEALGGKVQKVDTGWSVGVHQFEMTKQEPWMQPFQPLVKLLMMCQDQVVKMPPGSTLLAGTDHCPVGMFRVGPNMVGIQAHPEFSKEYNRTLMEARVDRMGEEVVKEGVASLEMELDAGVVGDWITTFLFHREGAEARRETQSKND